MTKFLSPSDRPLTRKRLGLSPHQYYYLYVGNLVPIKGIEYLLYAFFDLSKKCPRTRLILVGGGALEQHLKKIIAVLSLAQKVVIIGRRPPEEIPLWMNAADCLVHPSLAEGCCNVIREAAVARLPIIATDVVGINDFVKDRETGLLVPPYDVPQLREALYYVWRHRRQADQFARNALAKVKCYSSLRIARRQLAIYRQVLANRGKFVPGRSKQ